MERLEGHFQEGGRQNHPEERKEKTDPFGCPRTR